MEIGISLALAALKQIVHDDIDDSIRKLWEHDSHVPSHTVAQCYKAEPIPKMLTVECGDPMQICYHVWVRCLPIIFRNGRGSPIGHSCKNFAAHHLAGL